MSKKGIKAEVYKEEDPKQKQIKILKSEIKKLEEILSARAQPEFRFTRDE